MEPKTPQTQEKALQHDDRHEGTSCSCGMRQMQEEGECCGGGCCSEQDA